MKSPLKFSYIFALVYIILKLIAFNMGKSTELFAPLILVNILLVLMAILFGLKLHRKKNPDSDDHFVTNIKYCMRSASMYALLIAVFVMVYYSVIDRDFTAKIIDNQFSEITKEDFEEMKKKDPDMLRDKTIDDYKKLKREEMELFTSPFITTTMTLMGLMFLSLFYSIIIALAWPKFLNKVMM